MLAGCGDDEEAPSRPDGISDEAGRTVELGMARTRVAELLGEEPVLTAAPTRDARGGCDYYAMLGRPLANVWQFCFDGREKAKLGVTQYSPRQPPPPEGASAPRAVLIARGDAICQAGYVRLDGITSAVSRALRALDRDETAANRQAAGDQIARFVANLEHTHGQLAAFNAPGDGLEALEGYLSALGSQVEVLGDARRALLGGNDDRYDALGDEFNALAKTAKAEAREYGFTTCSASTFG